MPTANTEQTTSSTLPFGMEIGIAAIAWCLAWVIQLNLPALDYLPGIAIIFFPAGVRTLAVLVFGLRGAIGIFIASFMTHLWFSDTPKSLDYPMLEGLVIAAISAFSAYFMMRLVIQRYAINSQLAQLQYKHILLIVVSQGLLSATLHQIIYRLSTESPIYTSLTLHEMVLAWASMAIGDIVGAMLLLYSIATAARLLAANKG
jgi:hypothetical protein